MINAPTEKKPKPATFRNSSTLFKEECDSNNTILSSDEANDDNDKKTKGLAVVSFESDSENGTVSKEYCSAHTICLCVLFYCTYVFNHLT